jgi:bacteriocin biosynthesis cyclodehydratase domain-containing protein
VPVLNRPAFKAYFHVEPVAEDGTFLLSEHGHYVLFGESNALVASAIDGRRTADEIVDSLAGKATMQELYLSLATLERDGYLVESDPGADRPEAAFWAGLGVDSRAARERSAQRAVDLRSIAHAATADARRSLERAGLRVTDPADDGDAIAASLVLTDDYLRDELAAINDEHLRAGRPWMLCKPEGAYAWLGPIFVPGRTACWHCLAERLRGNREVEGLIERRGRSGPFPVALAAMPATVSATLELAALHLRTFLGADGASELTEQVVVSNWGRLDLRKHRVTRRPQCTACGDPVLALNSDDVALPRPTGRSMLADGGLRSVAARETYRRYEHLVGPLTGIVRDVVAADDGEELLHVYTAGHNFALKNDSLYYLRDGLRTNSGGKGRTAEQARASALCEAIERYSGIFRGDERRMRARLVDLDGLGVHPNDCMRFSDAQYRDRDAWMARAGRFHAVPAPFADDVEVEWTPVRSLLTGGTRYLPTGYLYYGYPADDGAFWFWADSNGNAAGNTLEEAELQGFLELAERDAVAVWWYNRVRRPAVDIASLRDGYVDELLGFYARHGRELWVLDVTNDLGIPAFVACSRRVDSPVEDIVLGFGAHLDARTAVLRAITELNQFLPAVLRRNPDASTAYAFDDPETLRWWQTATLASQPYLRPLEGPPRRIGDYAQRSSGDAGADVATCVQIAAAQGLETLVLNQTRPDVGLAVVKVLVPGLRHFWARLGPGRLYDVPVRMGWLESPLSESQLNPIPMFV